MLPAQTDRDNAGGIPVRGGKIMALHSNALRLCGCPASSPSRMITLCYRLRLMWNHREHRRCQTLRGWLTHVMAKTARHTRKRLGRRGAEMDGQTCTGTTQFHIRRILQ